MCEKAVIKKHKLSRVIGRSRWRINNALDRKCAPRAAGVIVEEALSLVGTKEDYSIMKRNCWGRLGSRCSYRVPLYI